MPMSFLCLSLKSETQKKTCDSLKLYRLPPLITLFLDYRPANQEFTVICILTTIRIWGLHPLSPAPGTTEIGVEEWGGWKF